MAGYGFITTSRAGRRNSDGSLRAGDPYAGTRPANGGTTSPNYSPSDPYASTGSGDPYYTGPSNSSSPSGGGSGGGSVFSPSTPSYTPQAPQSSYTPMNYQAGGPTQVSTSPVAGAAPVYPTVGNVAFPTGYDNSMAAYNDPDYSRVMGTFAQTGLPIM